MSKEERPYQTTAFSSGIAALEAVRAVLLVLATGLGKSYLIALLAKHFSRFGRILVLEPHRSTAENVAERRWASPGRSRNRLNCRLSSYSTTAKYLRPALFESRTPRQFSAP